MSSIGDLILSPAFTLLVFLAAIYTVGIHLFMGLGFKRLIIHWLLAMLGMAAGSALAVRANSTLPTLGDAHVIEASAAALLILLLLAWRARSDLEPEKPPAR
ncbi:MAG TPA: hypothetical protein VK009_26090 [Chloroflexota bacterium]|nr:hypothetical protein [Chloroflexota bacterium]